MRYFFFKVDPSTGILIDGTVAPSFTLFIDGTGTTQTAPTINNLTTGVYYFDYSPADQIIYEIDLGSDISALTARFIRGILDKSDDLALAAHSASEIKQKIVYYATADITISGRNVGANKPSHIEVKVNYDPTNYDFSTPDLTYYIVFTYNSTTDAAPASQTVHGTAPTDGTFTSTLPA